MDLDSVLVLLPGLFLGIALSASSGFRIFVPLLVGNLAAKFGLFTMSTNFAWLSSNTATIILAVACVFELAAYYVPVVDNFLDMLAAPASLVAGTILTTSFLNIEDPVLQWGLGIIAGGSVAGTIQAGTSLLRLGSTKFTGGLGNNFLASIENFFSFIIPFISLALPIFMGALALLFVFWLIRKFGTKLAQRFSTFANPNS